MGKTKIKTIDDSAPEADLPAGRQEKKQKKVKTEKTERVKVEQAAKSEHNETVGAVERPVEVEVTQEADAKQTYSEPTGRASGVSVSDEQIASKQSAGPRATSKTDSKKVRSKKYQEVVKLIDPNQKYALPEAIKLTQTTSYSKFPGTIEAHLNTNVKNIRGLVTLPFASGKKLKVLAFSSNKPEEIEGIAWGNDETISEIEKSRLKDVDIIVTTPEWMPKLAKIAKVLGPKGLMPNPKNGTITENLTKTIKELQSGKTEFKTQANSQVIHLGIGKVNQQEDEIAANIKVLYQTIGKSKISKITLASSMGPGVKVDLSSI